MNNWERGFLVGLIEGEGYLYILPRKAGTIETGLAINNTSEKLLRFTRKMLQKDGIKTVFYCYKYKGPVRANQQPLFMLRVSNQVSIYRLCKELVSSMVAKKEEMNLMLEFLESRLQGKWRHRARIHKRNDRGQIVETDNSAFRYTDREKQIMELFRARKRRKGAIHENNDSHPLRSSRETSPVL